MKYERANKKNYLISRQVFLKGWDVVPSKCGAF